MAPVKEVVFERVYDAPVEKVWQAWTDPALLKQWWGPKDVLIPECEVDLKEGGKFNIVMQAGEAMGPYKGTRWPMNAHFTAVEPNRRLVYNAKAWTEGAEEEMAIEQTTEIVFSAEDGKTKLKLTVTVHKIGPGAQMAIQGMQMGFNQQLDKLEKFLS